jgi:SAM-dependent methyltransferase
MNISCRVSQLWLALCIVVTATTALAQAPQQPYKPVEGQEGKDVVWVPTPPALVEKMLDLAKVTPDDYVIDLGSGDGRNVIAAARRGARALGVEYNPDLVELSKRAAVQHGVADKAMFVQGDMYEADISRATVLALFLLPENLRKLTAKFLNLRPGTRIVANYFGIDGWIPDTIEKLEGDCFNWCSALLYIVPAKVAGIWRLPQGELTLEQNFQTVSGTFNNGGQSVAISNARLHGDQISFAAGGVDYTGRVNGDTINGEMKSGASGAWTAIRTPPH